MAITFPIAELITLFEDLSELPQGRVLREGDPEPFGSHPTTLIYLYPSTVSVNGTDESRATYDDIDDVNVTEQCGVRRVTLRVKVLAYDVNAMEASLMETIRSRLYRKSSKAALRAVNLALIGVEAITSQDRADDGRNVMWGSMDVMLAWAVSETDTTAEGGIVETVNTTNEVPGTVSP